MFRGILDLILHPDAFFARAAQEKVNLVPPFLILGAGISVNIAMILLVFAGPGWSGYSPGFLRYGGLQHDVFLLFVLRAVVIPSGLWFALSLAAYGISRLLSGIGSFPATLQNTGYAMLPWTLSMVVPVLSSASRVATGVPIGYSGIWLTGPSVGCIVGLVVILWISFLGIFAIRHTHRFPIGKATGVIILSLTLSWAAYTALSFLLSGYRIGMIPVF